MSLEGRKFHFERDDDGHIYAENEMETEIANREGWLLPPRKGERHIIHYRVTLGNKIEVVCETTGELEDGHPVCKFVEVREINCEVPNDPIGANLHKIITEYAILSRSIYQNSQDVALKLHQAVKTFMILGCCASNAEKDSVCGGTCTTCREK
jgi:hypothetical protein